MGLLLRATSRAWVGLEPYDVWGRRDGLHCASNHACWRARLLARWCSRVSASKSVGAGGGWREANSSAEALSLLRYVATPLVDT